MKNSEKLLIIVLGVILFSIVFANFASASTSDNCSPTVTLLNQNPYPAVPGEYVSVVFQISGLDNPACTKATFQLNPGYPFSVSDNSTLSKSISGNTWVSGYDTSWMIPYKLMVAKDAYDSNYTLKVSYSVNNNLPVTQDFPLMVEDPRTQFDSVIQETSGTSVSIALADVGRYAANAVVVRVPNQPGYEVSGASGQMVGSLNSGDYTLVTFDINSVPIRGEENTNGLTLEVSYTDILGERRTVNLTLPYENSASGNFTLGSSRNFTGTNSGNFAAYGNFRTTQSKKSWSVWYTIIIIVAALGVLYYLKRKGIVLKNYKTKNKSIKKEKKKNNSDETPDWIKNEKQKENKR